MFDYNKRTFEVGDVVIVKNWATEQRLRVTRVTKLHAICEVKRADGSGYSIKFKREYGVSTSGCCFVSRVPRISFDMNEYKVIQNHNK